jgi:hypothetical protein
LLNDLRKIPAVTGGGIGRDVLMAFCINCAACI